MRDIASRFLTARRLCAYASLRDTQPNIGSHIIGPGPLEMRYPVIPARQSDLEPKYTRFARFMEHRKTDMDIFIDNHFQSNVGHHIYHYTGVDAAISILDSEEFWASEMCYVNDDSEINFGLGSLDEFLTEMEERFPVSNAEGKDQRFMFSSVFASLLRFSSKGPSSRNIFDSYLISFSTDHDSRYQWENYAANDTGVCIVFDHHTMSKAENVYGGIPKSGSVTYGRDNLRKLLRSTFDLCIDFVEGEVARKFFDFDVIMEWASQKFFENALAHIALFKDHGFGEEQEWRIWIVPQFDYPEICERDAGCRTIEFVKFSCESNLVENMTNYLPAITIIKGDRVAEDDGQRLSAFLTNDPHLHHIGIATKEEWHQINR